MRLQGLNSLVALRNPNVTSISYFAVYVAWDPIPSARGPGEVEISVTTKVECARLDKIITSSCVQSG